MIPILIANSCRFILFQVVKEKEINVLNTLITLNMKSRAYGLSYLGIQSVNTVWTSALLTLANIPSLSTPADHALFFLYTLIFGESMLLLSLITSTLFSDSKLSTQIGFMFMLAPVAVHIGIILYVDEARVYWLYAFSLFPHMPYLTLMQSKLNAYFDPLKRIQLDPDDEQAFFWIMVALIPVYSALYIYLDQIITGQQSRGYLCRPCCKTKKRIIEEGI